MGSLHEASQFEPLCCQDGPRTPNVNCPLYWDILRCGPTNLVAGRARGHVLRCSVIWREQVHSLIFKEEFHGIDTESRLGLLRRKRVNGFRGLKCEGL